MKDDNIYTAVFKPTPTDAGMCMTAIVREKYKEPMPERMATGQSNEAGEMIGWIVWRRAARIGDRYAFVMDEVRLARHGLPDDVPAVQFQDEGAYCGCGRYSLS